ncbi:MAG: Glu-tRNA(Gln) amidotransferase subunit GatE [Asgard group archaeon]|nr:Glu-tRNA(Gln) amidotransferase subunit GatE [Asgard group archaeon]
MANMTTSKEIQNTIDYTAIGLKCGLELHQQLETGRKLFCRCSSKLRLDAPQAIITRHMRPTLSELGEYDKAALMEFKKKKEIKYELHDSICSYEIDETPPFEPDPNAIDLAITIARLLHMDIIDELHVNRKQYLDGSIPTGFQRTMIVGIGGKIKTENQTINLDMLALEEDSCREVSNIGRTITWRVDRLGIPLVEIATKVFNVTNPDEVRIIAEKIGRILRATGKVKRGLGTIRQDLNISIAEGARVEIKGIQILDMLSDYVKHEVVRQLALLEIKDELTKRKLTTELITSDYLDCLSIFKSSKSKIIKDALKNKQSILGIKLPSMKGLLSKKVQLDRSFGKEIADRVKVITGLGGILHTDELPNYGITQVEVEKLLKLFKCEKNDAVAIVIGPNQDAIQAIDEIIIRVKEALEGVPEETRHAQDDGTTSFRRYLGGAGRMYPDTDSYPIILTEARIKRIDDTLPELPDKREERYLKELKLPEEIAKNLAISSRAMLFDELVKIGVDPILGAVTLEQTIKALSRDGVQTENLTDNRIKNIFDQLVAEKISKEAIEPLLVHFSNSPQSKMELVLEELNLVMFTEEQVGNIIDEVLKRNTTLISTSGKRAMGKLMGQVMEEVRGRYDGQKVNELMKKRFDKKLSELKKEQ